MPGGARGNVSGLNESELFVAAFDGNEVASLTSFKGTIKRLIRFDFWQIILNTDLHSVIVHSQLLKLGL